MKGNFDNKIIKHFRIRDAATVHPSIIIRGIPEDSLKETGVGVNKLLVSHNFIHNLIQNNNLVSYYVNNINVINCFKNKSYIKVILEINPSLLKFVVNRSFLLLS